MMPNRTVQNAGHARFFTQEYNPQSKGVFFLFFLARKIDVSYHAVNLQYIFYYIIFEP